MFGFIKTFFNENWEGKWDALGQIFGSYCVSCVELTMKLFSRAFNASSTPQLALQRPGIEDEPTPEPNYLPSFRFLLNRLWRSWFRRWLIFHLTWL